MFCPNCGAELQPGNRFCPSCGAAVENQNSDSAVNAGSNGPAVNAGSYATPNQPMGFNPEGFSNNQNYGNNRPVSSIMERSIGLSILLSFVTCGIYAYYWLYKLNEEVNELSDDREATNGVLVIVFSILTCGIYTIYWFYKMGQRCNIIANDPNGGREILYLILPFIGLGIVSFCLIQDTINKAVRGTYR